MHSWIEASRALRRGMGAPVPPSFNVVWVVEGPQVKEGLDWTSGLTPAGLGRSNRAEEFPAEPIEHGLELVHEGSLDSLNSLIDVRSQLAERMQRVSALVEWPVEILSDTPPVTYRTDFIPDRGSEHQLQQSQLQPLKYLQAWGAPKDRIAAARALAVLLDAVHSADVVLGSLGMDLLRFWRDAGTIQMVVLFSERSRMAGHDSPAQQLLGTGPVSDFVSDRVWLAQIMRDLLLDVSGSIDEALVQELGAQSCRGLKILVGRTRESADRGPYPRQWVAALEGK